MHGKLRDRRKYLLNVSQVCLETGCETLTIAGVNDASSWLRRFEDVPERYTGDPLLFDDRYQPKPAYHAVCKALAE